MKKIFTALIVSSLLSACSSATIEESPSTELFTLETIGTHSVSDDCWMAINEKVYDVTSMIGAHPGGEAILEGCGRDATELFDTRPSGSGTPHSEKANIWLEDFYIGNLETNA